MKSKKAVYPCYPIRLIFVLLILLAPQPARGWGQTWMGASLEQMVKSARWKAGLLRYSAALKFDNAGHDSDIYFGTTAARVPDYTLRAGVPFSFFLPVNKKLVIDVSENPQYVYYLETKKERALNNEFMGHVHLVFDRVYFQAGGGLSNVKQRLSPELMLNVRQKINDLTGLVLWQVSKGGSLALQYQTSVYRYDNPPDSGYNISENLNRRESFLNFTAYIQQVSKTRFFLDAEYGSYVFKEAIARDKDSRSYGIYGGVEFLPAPEVRGQGRGVQGRINLGYKYFDFIDPQRKGYSGLVGNTSVSIALREMTSVQGFFSRDFQFSAFSSLAYYLITSYGGGLSRSLTRKSRLDYALSFSRGVYPSDETIGGGQPRNLLIRYSVHSFRLTFKLRRDLELGLMASLGNRKGNVTFPGGNRFFAGFNLTYGYPGGEAIRLTSPVSR
jgi:hypothetical protein